MENSERWEHKKLVDELTRGMELAQQLKTHMNSTVPSVSRELLLQKIQSSFEVGLGILNRAGSSGQPQSLVNGAGVLESSNSGDGSLPMEQREQFDASKKRKTLPTWTEQVRVCSENGLEGPADDGHRWRKYGQKDILGTKYPRSYYRCTYRNGQNCWATKQVQRSDEDPTVFEVIYRGEHTCKETDSQSNQELKQKNNLKHLLHNPSFSFGTNLWVGTENLASHKDMANSVSYADVASGFTFPSSSTGWITEERQHSEFSALINDNNINTFGGLSPPAFLSPATSETNYFSASTSASNSPIADLDFSIDPVELDHNFPFDTPGFFI
ncbi:hypothetical protein NMG60_11030529 [Bertholletia excelsa]